jgi:two-component system chemotaxis sensor kinase CheA
MDEFELELKTGFLEEASQLLTEVESCFLNLESNPNDSALLDKIFRLAHNLKGSAKAVGFEDVGAFAHIFESLLLKVKNGEIAKSSPLISLLLRCNDFLNESVAQLKVDLNSKIDAGSLTQEIQDAMNGKFDSEAKDIGQVSAETETANEADSQNLATAALSPEQETVPEESVSQTVSADQPSEEEIAALLALETEQQLDKLEKEFQQAEKTATTITPPTPAANSQSVSPASPPKEEKKSSQPVASATEESIRVSLARVDKLLNYVGELVILETVLKEQALHNGSPLLRRSVHQIGKVTKEIQDLSMGLRMVPVKQTFQKMQRIVRDTAGLLQKKVNLVLEGEETELDKTVLENIGDPLVHLVRNAVDHGIETPEARQKAGKSPEGTLILRAYHQAGKLIIEVRDDGGGINTEILKKKAVKKKILPAGKELSHQDAVNLIFHPGFSTKQVVTEVSGRGVGMDVVKTNIEALQGEIQIETILGQGTCFKVMLPLTLAIIDGMVVRCGEERFVIPLSQVHESVQPDSKDIQVNVGQLETFILRREPMPMVRLGHALGRKYVRPATKSIAIVIRTTQKPFAILVDDIVGQHQVVVKKLGPELQGIKSFSGSAVLGDGRPALILEPAEIAAQAKPIPKLEIEKMEAAAA